MAFEYKKTIAVQNSDKELNAISKEIDRLNLPKGFFQFVVYALSELLANIKEHAKTKRASVGLKMGGQKCSITVVDKGVGFKRPYLLKKIYVKDDFAAIEFALNGLSTKNLQERGFGLYSIRKLVEELDGEMAVKSGSAGAIIQRNKITFQHLANKTQGVDINIEIPVKAVDFYKTVA